MGDRYLRKSVARWAKFKVKIFICGFSEHETLSARIVGEWLDLVPDHLLEGLRSIIYQPPFTMAPMSRLSVNENRSWAFYHQESKTITLCSAGTYEQYIHCLFHELGHHVFYSRLDARLRKKWVTVLAQDEQPVSAYGARNGREEFAECFAFFFLQAGRLDYLPLKRRFLMDEVLAVPEKRVGSSPIRRLATAKLSQGQKLDIVA